MTKQATLFSATLGEDKKVEPPLGPLYIASALQEVGWEVDFRDYQTFEGADAFHPELIVECLDGHAAVVMISCFVDMLPVVIAASAALKSLRPDTCIVLGGPGPTAGAADLVRRFSAIDAIVMGEGEATIQEWAQAYDPARGLPSHPIAGMVYRSGADVVEGPMRPRMMEGQLGSLPAYELLDWSRYSAGRIVTTRGCPYRCSFCDVAPLWGRKAVYRDVAAAVDEMILLRSRYGCSGVAIADDTFVLNRDRVRAFCNLLIERRVGMEWGCFGRINLMSEDLIELMAQAGCRAIFYGIDSGSPPILERTFKELDATTILPTLEISARHFQVVEASFIWGYPFETLDDFLLTLRLASDASQFAPTVNVQLHMLSPLPSSPVYREFTGRLLPPEPEDRGWMLLPGLLVDERAAAVRDVIAAEPRLFPGFFTFPTPDKQAKRAKLAEVSGALDAMLGRMVLDDSVRSLMTAEHDELESRLLSEADPGSERIGVGLALGMFRRTRLSAHRQTSRTLEGSRTASLVRQRNDAAGTDAR